MIPILSAVFLLLLSINLVLGLNKATILVQTAVFSNNILNNKSVIGEAAGVSVENKIPVPVNKTNIPAPTLSAGGVVVKDLESQTIIYAKNENVELPIASTTKIMTALVGSSHYDINDVLEVKDLSRVSGSTMGLKPEEKLTFRSLLYGMLLNSGNDAAFVIAQNYPSGLNGFVMAMNQKAHDLNLTNTHFTNPAGFDDPHHYSSASDLSIIAQSAIEDPEILKVVGTKDSVVASIDKANIHTLHNLNILLAKPGFIGIKTGFTPTAKENFVGLYEKDSHRILTVVLGSDDRFGETEKLVNWVYENFEWQ